MDTSWLERARLVAVVDRVAFVLELNTPASFGELKEYLPRARRRTAARFPRWFLTAIGDDNRRYRITIQDPPSVTAMSRIIGRLQHDHPTVGPPLLDVLEVALDAYPLELDTVELERVTADLCKGSKFSPAGGVRAAGSYRGSGMGLLGEDAAYKAVKSNRTIYDGDRGGSHMKRLYVKRADDKGKFALPAAEHRSRFEIEYRGAGLPVQALPQLFDFRYEALAKHFHQWTLREDLQGLRLLLADRRSRLCREPRRVRHRRDLPQRAFTKFNKKAYDALRCLSRRMSGPGVEAGRCDRSAQSAGG